MSENLISVVCNSKDKKFHNRLRVFFWFSVIVCLFQSSYWSSGPYSTGTTTENVWPDGKIYLQFPWVEDWWRYPNVKRNRGGADSFDPVPYKSLIETVVLIFVCLLSEVEIKHKRWRVKERSKFLFWFGTELTSFSKEAQLRKTCFVRDRVLVEQNITVLKFVYVSYFYSRFGCMRLVT